MRQPAGPTHLVAPAGSALRAAAGLLRAIPGTVNLAAVAAAADQSLGTAAHTQEQPGRRRVGVLRTADPLMTNAVVAAILPRHTCPARCGARRRSETRQLGSAPCEPLMVRLLPPHRQPLSPNARTDRGRALPGDGVLWSGLRPSRRTPSPASFRTNAHATGITRILTAADTELRAVPASARPITRADLEWLAARRAVRRNATADAGRLVSAMRDEDQR